MLLLRRRCPLVPMVPVGMHTRVTSIEAITNCWYGRKGFRGHDLISGAVFKQEQRLMRSGSCPLNSGRITKRLKSVSSPENPVRWVSLRRYRPYCAYRQKAFLSIQRAVSALYPTNAFCLKKQFSPLKIVIPAWAIGCFMIARKRGSSVVPAYI
ncbi:hypothetical protein SAMN02745216_00150 [Desulfatibacillum alkenivorans DSM 16219]|uniref:Uncharacterized protein n=1 Tax=Desulfatibacillum alkenivorans DSM 16219 TaxID=1121393 RepID=A0A1M6C4R0_9BACT|nr:hypothetical protein SAMN02745216_00150 [Desulfatibacillum alkenivorans DSM 16219]